MRLHLHHCYTYSKIVLQTSQPACLDHIQARNYATLYMGPEYATSSHILVGSDQLVRTQCGCIHSIVAMLFRMVRPAHKDIQDTLINGNLKALFRLYLAALYDQSVSGISPES